MTPKERDLLIACARAIAYSAEREPSEIIFRDRHKAKVKELLEEVRDEDGTGIAPKPRLHPDYEDAKQPYTHPIQPLEWDDKVIRFKRNKIIEWMLEAGRTGQKFDLNSLAMMPFTDEDRMQLAMLIGYSVSGFGDLSYANPELVARCDAMAEAMEKASGVAPKETTAKRFAHPDKPPIVDETKALLEETRAFSASLPPNWHWQPQLKRLIALLERIYPWNDR